MLRNNIHTIIKHSLEELDLPTNKLVISPPNNENFGDYATNIALQLAKELKKDPFEIAEKIAENIEIKDPIGSVRIIRPGFINITISQKVLIDNVASQRAVKNIIPPINKGKNIIVEYSSPNIAKPFTVGHLRSTIIGDAIANILKATGATIFRDNHLGDWGTQFGKLIYAIKEWGDEEQIKNAENPVKILVGLYVRFHQEAEKNPDLDEKGRKWFKKLEDGDKEARRLWEQSVEWSWHEFNALYNKLGINTAKFENNGRGYGESYFEDKMDPVIKELKEKKILTESKGAWLVFFPDKKYPPMMLIKQDGATLYATRDLATDKFRLEKYGKDIAIINEVGAEQALYFKQLYEIEVMAGWFKREQRIHIKHGMYRFKDQKMSTRKGNTIWLEDVLEEAYQRAHKIAVETGAKEESNKKSTVKDIHIVRLSKRKEVAQKVAIGALKWNDLRRNAHLDIVFDWDDILNMQGNSGPYVQYTYVRCKSVLDKASSHTGPENTWILNQVQNDKRLNDEEFTILRTLSKYPETVVDAAQSSAPNYLCLYLYDLSQKYNLFYQKHTILKAEDTNTKNFRLAITHSVAHTLHHGLGLLGIQTVEKM